MINRTIAVCAILLLSILGVSVASAFGQSSATVWAEATLSDSVVRKDLWALIACVNQNPRKPRVCQTYGNALYRTSRGAVSRMYAARATRPYNCTNEFRRSRVKAYTQAGYLGGTFVDRVLLRRYISAFYATMLQGDAIRGVCIRNR